MPILVIGEHDNASLKSGTAHAVTAATKMGADVHVLVAGKVGGGVAAAAAQLAGVTKVLACEAEHYASGSPENLAALAAPLAKGYSHVVAAASAFGKNVMPRIAAMLDVAQVSEIVAVQSPDTFVRPIYAGNAFATVQSADPIKVVTVRTTGFDAAGAGGSAAIESVAPGPDKGQSKVLSQELTKSARPELAGARRVVSGGRGLASGENFKMLETLADKLGAAIGASRAAVDSGFVPNDYQVGQTGKIVAPRALYRDRHLGRDPAPRGHEGQQGDRRDQQGSGGADLPGRRLRIGGRSLPDRAGIDGEDLTMAEYVAPIKDMQFVLKHVVGLDQVNTLPGWEEVTEDLVDAILEEAGKFASEVLSPLNATGDRQGAKYSDGTVTMPSGFKEAYAQYIGAGWNNILSPTAFGGQGLPHVIATPVEEMLGAANLAFKLCPMLTQGAIEAIAYVGLRCPAEDIPAEDGLGRVDGHDEPHGAPGGKRLVARAHEGHAPARRQLPREGPEESSSPTASTITPRTSSTSRWRASKARPRA
jgi:electron transfer flavoprotein alpha subunit